MLGVAFAKVMGLLTVPTEVLAALKGPEYLTNELNFWVLITAAIAHTCLFGMTLRNSFFGFIG